MGQADQPLVSAVLPVFNGERFLRDAIESILGQTYPALEIIVVDDGSSDGSPAVLADYRDGITVLRQPNSGVATSRNAGVRASHGEFVAFLDQDDWWLPDKIAKQAAICVSDGDVDLVHTGIRHYDDRMQSFVGPLSPGAAPQLLVGNCYSQLLMGNAIYNSTVMVRKAAVDRIGGFDTTIPGNTVADYDLWLRLARQSKFAFLPEELAVCRLHDEQGTWKRRDMLAAELRLLTSHVAEPARRTSSALRGRFARLQEDLGLAHLDAKDAGTARRYFARSLREERSVRRIGLYLASLLPASSLSWIRSIRGRAERPAG